MTSSKTWRPAFNHKRLRENRRYDETSGRRGTRLVLENENMRDTRTTALHGAKLIDCDFSNSSRVLGFDRAELIRCSFVEYAAGFAHFREGRVQDCDFSDAIIQSGRYDDATVTGTRFDRAHMERSTWIRSRFVGCSFRRAAMADARFDDDSVFEQCDFSAADLRRRSNYFGRSAGATFLRCDFTGANFDRRRLLGARFEDCVLTGVSGLPFVDETTVFVNPTIAGRAPAWMRRCTIEGPELSFEAPSETATVFSDAFARASDDVGDGWFDARLDELRVCIESGAVNAVHISGATTMMTIAESLIPRFAQLCDLLVSLALSRGSSLEFRPDVGGACENTSFHRTRDNLDRILPVLDKYKDAPLDIVFPVGHFATPEQIARIAALGATTHVSVASDAGRQAETDSGHPLLHFLFHDAGVELTPGEGSTLEDERRVAADIVTEFCRGGSELSIGEHTVSFDDLDAETQARFRRIANS